jgi:hypothetical protein
VTSDGYSYCPRCGAEYRAGFTVCADCRVPLVDTPPPGSTVTELHPDDPVLGPIVELTRRSSRFEADVIIAKLRSAGIPVTMFPSDAGGWYPHLGFAEGYRVMVAGEDLDDARLVIAEGRVRRRRRSRS